MENRAEEVLAIKLPGTPDESRDMIQNIRDKLSNVTNFQEDLKKLEGQAKTAKELLEKALEIKLAYGVQFHNMLLCSSTSILIRASSISLLVESFSCNCFFYT